MIIDLIIWQITHRYVYIFINKKAELWEVGIDLISRKG